MVRSTTSIRLVMSNFMAVFPVCNRRCPVVAILGPSPVSDLPDAAVDAQIDAGHEGALVRREEDRRLRILRGDPSRPSVMAASNFSLADAAWATGTPSFILAPIGVSVGPGLKLFTRIRRCFRSLV